MALLEHRSQASWPTLLGKLRPRSGEGLAESQLVPPPARESIIQATSFRHRPPPLHTPSATPIDREKSSQDGRPQTDVGEHAEDPPEGAEAGISVRSERQTHTIRCNGILILLDRFGGAGRPGGSPKAALGGVGLLIAGTGAIWMFNNALFNGTKRA